MKISIDLPADLVRKVKLLAAREGSSFGDVAARILRKSLTEPHTPYADQPKLVKDKKTGLPMIKCKRAIRKNGRLTPKMVDKILLDQEVANARGLGF